MMAMEILPRTVFGARLEQAGLSRLPNSEPEQVQAALAAIGAPDSPAAEGAEEERWDRWELAIWNQLLPLQDARGRFASPEGTLLTHDALAGALASLLSRSVEAAENALVFHLPVAARAGGNIAGSYAEWELETAYPEQGAVSLTFGPKGALQGAVHLRVPSGATAVQLLRNGSPAPQEWQGRYLTLPGPWQPGDNISLRFGLPFRLFRSGQDLLHDRPLERSYPGSPAAENAFLYLGLRRIVPLEGEPAEAAAGASAPPEHVPVSLGARKDGAILLAPDPAYSGSPFELEGDAFREAAPPHRRLVALELWNSLASAPIPQTGSTFQFVPFETTFDRGAG